MSEKIGIKEYYLPSTDVKDYLARVKSESGNYQVIGRRLGTSDPEEAKIRTLRKFHIIQATEPLRDLQHHREEVVIYNELHEESTLPDVVAGILVTKIEDSDKKTKLDYIFEGMIEVYKASTDR
jgi:hypothetical protein